jgi:hypothetical protein
MRVEGVVALASTVLLSLAIIPLGAQAQAQGDREAVRRIAAVRKHYMIRLTSEFSGESIVALHEGLDTSRLLFTREQASQARAYVHAIQQQWHSSR